MFSPHARIGSRAEQDRLLRHRAAEEGAILFARHGPEAATLVSRELRRSSESAEERRYQRLVIAEIERLHRVERGTAEAVFAEPPRPRRWWDAARRR